MKKVAIIGCYFGQLRKDVSMWLKSCANNPEFNWLIVTDCIFSEVPENVTIISMSFPEFRHYVQDRFDFPIVLEKPYKICDYRPAFGHIFAEYLTDYDFWGYCDFDMIFGHLSHFITEEILDQYDKIYHLGHLSLYRNTKLVNEAYRSTKGSLSYQDVFSTNINRIFDEESGIYEIFRQEGLKCYVKLEFVDLDRFTNHLLHSRLVKYYDFVPPIDYKYQTFLYQDGCLFKVYKTSKNAPIQKEEIAYLHYSGKEFAPLSADQFLITSHGFQKIPEESHLFDFDQNLHLWLEKKRSLCREYRFRLHRKIAKIKMKRNEEKTNATSC